MSKQQKKITPQAKSKETGNAFSNPIPEKYQTPALLLLLLLLILIFFSPVMFGDKTTQSGDLLQVKSLREYVTKDRDGFSLWNPYLFCGMPAVATSVSLRWFDLTAVVYSYTSKLYSSFFKDYNAIYTISFVILALTSFFFMRRFGAGRSVSFLVAAATIFSTGIMVLFFIGHITKLMSLAIFPFILMMLFKFQKEIKILDVLLFVFGMHLLVLGAHVQIVFYLVLTAFIYFAFFFIHSFIEKNKTLQKQLLKSLAVVAGAGAVALLMSLDSYAQLYEYKPYSTRGTKSITEQINPSIPSQTDSYEYNTNWSFSPGEVVTFIVPSFYGFGKSTYNGPLTQNQDFEVNTYFGQMPFVDTAMYMGVIIFMLGLFTLFVRWKEPMVKFLGITVILFLFLSFGKNFPIIFNLLYNYLPGFDNFRAPSMVLHVIQILFPILAGLGVMKLISLREQKNSRIEKILKNSAIAIGGLFLLSLILGTGIGDWFIQRVKDHAAALGQNQNSQMFVALSEYMADMFKGDLSIALLLITIAAGLSYAFVTSKIKKEVFIGGLTILILFDLFRIGTRGSSYIDSRQIKELFMEPDYISVIKNEKEKLPFRILNMRRDGMGSLSQNSNYHVYFLQEDLVGYSAVKPRSFQDIVDVVTPANFTLWKMLGVKYLITDKAFPFEYFSQVYMSPDSTTFVNRNNAALPRIYFVDNVEQKSGIEVLNLIKENKFDPKKIAFVENLDFKFDKADSSSTADITDYKDEYIAAQTYSDGNNFLFFGTTYLPTWKSLIDGNETKIYKTNYGFQGIVVPKGKHKVEFIYEPTSFIAGKYVSLILNLLLFGGIGFVIYKSRKQFLPDKQ